MNKQISIIKIAWFIWVFAIVLVPAVAQQSASPFDILPRLPKSSHPDSATTDAAPSNPFDINRIDVGTIPPSSVYTPQFQVERKKKTLSVKEKTALYQRFLFITIMIMLVLMTLVITIFRIFISNIWKAFLNDNILSQLFREQGSGVTFGYMILYFLFFINAGIFTFLALRYFDVIIASSNVQALLLCIGGIAGFYSLKHLLLGIVRYIFPVEKEVGRYIFTVMIFNIVSGIFLAPMILFAAYSSDSISGAIIKLTIAILFGVILFRGLRGLFIANQFFVWHKFHFFLYLCTVELAPLMIAFKLLELF